MDEKRETGTGEREWVATLHRADKNQLPTCLPLTNMKLGNALNLGRAVVHVATP